MPKTNTYKSLVQLNISNNNKKTCSNNKKLPKDLDAHFSREVIEMAIKHIKRGLALRVLKEKQSNVQ